MTGAMRKRNAFLAALPLTLLAFPGASLAQAPPAAAQKPAPTAPRRPGGFVPGQKREAEDPATVARGKTLFEINCRACHGADLRGGDMGGPNLLRSPAALTDRHGELIVPIIQGSRQKQGMPAINISPDDAQAVAAYVRQMIGGIGSQGRPPEADRKDPDILVGNANEGKAYFAAKCSGCHSVTNDLKGYASRITDQKKLQSTWVAGGRDSEELSPSRTPTAEVKLRSGQQASGLVVHIDDFLVTLKLADGTQRSFARRGPADPEVTIHDPLKTHRDMLSQYTDKDIHDVTAYLITLK